MQSASDLYACLGVERTATPDQIRQAYQHAGRRFHPDTNSDPQAQEEFRRIAAAYEVLNDPRRRSEYDSKTANRRRPVLKTSVMFSRTRLMRLAEPQIVYTLVEISAQAGVVAPDPLLNLCLVLDRSTSMQGARLDQVKAAANQIVTGLSERDVFSIVTFSDRADVVLPAQPCTGKATILSKISSIAASGGTEILQGLLCGLLEVQRNLSSKSISHLVLLTDGRTYGDEDDCLLLAQLAEGDGITISGLGIGDEWNDAFIDRLASGTGGQSHYVSSPAIVTHLLSEQVQSLSDSMGHVHLQAICDPGVRLKSAFRVSPDAQPIVSEVQPMNMGKLMRHASISVLLEFVVATTPDTERPVARLWVIGDILSADGEAEHLPLDVRLPQTDKPDNTAPPVAIVSALDKLTLYRLQEKAWADAEDGNIGRATQRLQTLASRLMASGESELATVALNEAARLSRTHQISSENRKRIKYGTRSLIPSTR